MRGDRRVSAGQTIARSLAVLVLTALGAELLALLLPGFAIDTTGGAVLVALVVGVVNAVIWPALAVVVAPIGVLTLGLGALVLNAIVVGLALEPLPGVRLDGLGAAVAVTLGLAAVNMAVSSFLALDDDGWFDRRTARVMRRRARRRGVTDVPGIVFVQLDGLARPVLERAMRSGHAPTIDRLVREGEHRLVGWVPAWSCQTGVSQCGILHGSVQDMPAFRWLEKDRGVVMVSNHPSDAAEIQRRHSAHPGLLAHHGSSYGNLFSGDAERAALTMSVVARTKEGRVGAGYARYFAQPYQAFRTLLGVLVEVGRERRAAADQRRWDVRPRVGRGRTYALVRAFTTVVSRDVSLAGVLNDMAEGRAAIYVDFLGYDEVAHHSGLERADSLQVIRGLDRQLARIVRGTRWTARPYHVVVLSDHGQTQGPTFEDRYGERLADLVARVTGSVDTARPREDEGATESAAVLRAARHRDKAEVPGDAPVVVLASGNLGLVSLRAVPGRASLEEIEQRYPELVRTLVAHPGVGFVLVRSDERGSLLLSARGTRVLATGEVTGEDPLAPFGPHALDQVRDVDGYATVADLMVNSTYDPDRHEVVAFEDQVSSHGGLGGEQQEPFLLYPSVLTDPPGPLLGPVAVHRQLRRWLREVGQPVTLPWEDAGDG